MKIVILNNNNNNNNYYYYYFLLIFTIINNNNNNFIIIIISRALGQCIPQPRYIIILYYFIYYSHMQIQIYNNRD